MNLHTWKDGELEYCIELVDMGGNRSVPFASVRSYLSLQHASAIRDGRQDVADKLGQLLVEWDALLAKGTK